MTLGPMLATSSRATSYCAPMAYAREAGHAPPTKQSTTVYNVEVADWHIYLISWWMFVVFNASKICITGTSKKYSEGCEKQNSSLLASLTN
jgi:hypothetical protein